MTYIPQGKYENTVKECTKALELNPMYVKALVRRGEAHEKLEHFEEAIAGELKKIIRAGGNYTDVLLGLHFPHLTDTARVWELYLQLLLCVPFFRLIPFLV